MESCYQQLGITRLPKKIGFFTIVKDLQEGIVIGHILVLSGYAAVLVMHDFTLAIPFK